jgi:hypothetical protein
MTSRGLVTAGACILAPVTVLKVVNVKPVEIFLLVAFPLLLLGSRDTSFLRLRRPVGLLTLNYVAFFFGALFLAVLSLRLEFYPPQSLKNEVFRSAPIIALETLLQLGLCVATFLVLSEWFADNQRLLRFAMRLYVWVGLIVIVYGIISYVVSLAFGIDLLGAYAQEMAPDSVRARGLFNEGGELGLYVVSVILVANVLRAYRHMRRWPYLLTILVCLAGLIVSKSKAGAVCLVLLLGWSTLRHLRLRYLLAGAALTGLIVVTTPIIQALGSYWWIYQNYDEIAYLRREDLNVIAGRAAAVSVVPAMVAMHPLAGIGIGHYGLMRGNPAVGIPAAQDDIWDLSGLGIFTYTAELGMPLFLYLYLLVWWPWHLCKQTWLPASVMTLAGFQLAAQSIEIQPTFIYPWLVSAMTMGLYLRSKGGESGAGGSP